MSHDDAEWGAFGITFDIVEIAFPTFSHHTPTTQRAQYTPTTMHGQIINTATTTTIKFLLPCITYEPVAINASEKRVSDPTKTVLEHQTMKTSQCGQLHQQWLYNPPLSQWHGTLTKPIKQTVLSHWQRTIWTIPLGWEAISSCGGRSCTVPCKVKVNMIIIISIGCDRIPQTDGCGSINTIAMCNKPNNNLPCCVIFQPQKCGAIPRNKRFK
jgi:hypothetical protein